MVAPLMVVMGVSGSGKSTVGARLASRQRLPFCEGDSLHSADCIAKLRTGTPLTDQDREPWLDRINVWLRAQAAGGVVSCSALRRTYRDRLRDGLAQALQFVLLDPPPDVLARRLTNRVGHFMPAELLSSQLSTLERPAAGESALKVGGDEPVEVIVSAVLSWIDANPS